MPGANKSGPLSHAKDAVSAARIAGVGVMIAMLGGCGASDRAAHAVGDPNAGAIVIARKACGSCHEIPGIEEADGMVGPSLAHFASRQMIAGTLANSPANLALYLKAPQTVVKGNIMPDQGLTDEQVRDAAAYLYTLR